MWLARKAAQVSLWRALREEERFRKERTWRDNNQSGDRLSGDNSRQIAVGYKYSWEGEI
jgi:hypothetical protein